MAKKANVSEPIQVTEQIEKEQPVEKKTREVSSVECFDEGRAPYTKVLHGSEVCFEVEQGYVKVVSNDVKLLIDSSKELFKLTEGKVSISEKGTVIVNSIDTDELKEKVWY